jgi:hypothetical protein
MSKPPDRFHKLLDQDKLTGIDFIYVDQDDPILLIYFFHTGTLIPRDLLEPSLSPSDISIRSISKTKKPVIPVKELSWENDYVLNIIPEFYGDLTFYRLLIVHEKIDVFFNSVIFSFAVHCDTGLDCKQKEHECPPEPVIDFPVDYMARDFWSYRKALLDFASLRYPGWKDRLEADAGIMLMEVMCALGDETAYYQDRIGREAYLETATQRRSVRRHARLIDYDIDDGQGAATWLDCTVSGTGLSIPSGINIYALADNREQIDFETGAGLEDYMDSVSYPADEELNSLAPYIMDENSACLPVGATEMYLEGHHQTVLAAANELAGKWVLLQTNPQDASIPARRHMARLVKAENTVDLLNNNHKITRIVWDDVQSLPFEMCMKCHFEVHGNMVPITAGKREKRKFVIGKDHATIERAVEREAHDGTVVYLFSFPDSNIKPLAWAVNPEDEAVPQVHLAEMLSDDSEVEKPEGDWICRRSLVGTKSSDPDDRHYTLDDGMWKEVVDYQRVGKKIIHKDYTSGGGTTIRFGDGEFGRIPSPGAIFQVTYRLGGGAKSNVPADSIINIYDASGAIFITAIRNPFATTNGRDPESLDRVRNLAPFRFRSITERAVIPYDYALAAERLDWVQKAGASFRWTGSWISAFVTPDTKGAAVLDANNRLTLVSHLDRFRQAGKEVHVMNPLYADLDFEITICVAKTSYKGEVKEKVLEALFGKTNSREKEGYFSPDNFTFGTLLYRSSLETVIKSVTGVNTVISINFRRRGFFPMISFLVNFYDPGKNSIIRVENDPRYTERGSVKLIMEGGA